MTSAKGKEGELIAKNPEVMEPLLSARHSCRNQRYSSERNRKILHFGEKGKFGEKNLPKERIKIRTQTNKYIMYLLLTRIMKKSW